MITQSEYARRKNVSRQRVGQWVMDGTIRLVDGKVDPDLADRQLEHNLDYGKRMDYDLRSAKLKTDRKKKDPWDDIHIDLRPFLKNTRKKKQRRKVNGKGSGTQERGKRYY